MMMRPNHKRIKEINTDKSHQYKNVIQIPVIKDCDTDETEEKR